MKIVEIVLKLNGSFEYEIHNYYLKGEEGGGTSRQPDSEVKGKFPKRLRTRICNICV